MKNIPLIIYQTEDGKVKIEAILKMSITTEKSEIPIFLASNRFVDHE